jgi:hypothetical protein
VRLKIRNKQNNCLGRWTTCTFSGKANTRLTVITIAYQVCNDSISRTGPNTACAQQWTLLRTIHGDLDPDPRKQFIIDLDSLIT